MATHYIDPERPLSMQATACGIPAANGQVFVKGQPKSATTRRTDVTCDGCVARLEPEETDLPSAAE